MTAFAGKFLSNERIVAFADETAFFAKYEAIMAWLDRNRHVSDAAVLARFRATFAGGGGGENETLGWYAQTLMGHSIGQGAPEAARQRIIGIMNAGAP